MEGVARHGAAGKPAAGVGVAQGVVHAVSVAVEALGSGRIVDKGIHRKEAAGQGVVAASVHVDKAEVVVVLVQGETTVEGGGHVVVSEADGVAAAAPSVVAQPLHGVAADGGGEAPYVVFQRVVHGGLSVALRGKDSKQSRSGGEIVEIFCQFGRWMGKPPENWNYCGL